MLEKGIRGSWLIARYYGVALSAGLFAVSSLVFWNEQARAVGAMAFWQQSFKPAAFSFTAQTGVATGSPITSNVVTLAGIGTRGVTATCSGCTLQRNQTGGFFSSISGFKKGDRIEIRVTSSSSNSTLVTSSVTVGTTTSSSWSVTTAAPPGDPYLANVVLLMRMDDLTDATGRHAFSAAGGAQITTSLKKFGTGSLKLVSNGFLTKGNTEDFFFGTGDFTIEAWVYRVSGSGVTLAEAHECNKGSWSMGIGGDGSFGFSAFRYGGDAGLNAAAGTVSAGTWHHVAVSRAGGYGRLFLNGVVIAEGAVGTNISNNGEESRIGATYLDTCHQYDSYASEAYIDSIRVTKGVARYTSNFSVPTSDF